MTLVKEERKKIQCGPITLHCARRPDPRPVCTRMCLCTCAACFTLLPLLPLSPSVHAGQGLTSSLQPLVSRSLATLYFVYTRSNSPVDLLAHSAIPPHKHQKTSRPHRPRSNLFPSADPLSPSPSPSPSPLPFLLTLHPWTSILPSESFTAACELLSLPFLQTILSQPQSYSPPLAPVPSLAYQHSRSSTDPRR